MKLGSNLLTLSKKVACSDGTIHTRPQHLFFCPPMLSVLSSSTQSSPPWLDRLISILSSSNLFDCCMSPLNFVLDDTRPYCCQIWLTYVSSHICTHPKNTCTRWYTLSFSNLMSYIFLVISVLDDKIHPVTFVLKWCFNILPTPSSCLGYVSPCYVIHPYFSCVCMQCNIDLDDKYTLSPSYSNDVLISIWLHPAASVRIPLLRHTPPF